jgi:hypothetical protein
VVRDHVLLMNSRSPILVREAVPRESRNLSLVSGELFGYAALYRHGGKRATVGSAVSIGKPSGTAAFLFRS